MGVLERKERERELRRNQIIASGEKLFVSQGLKNTTMEQIAQECEISRGTLYLYFKNKEDIFFTILLNASDVLYNSMKAKIIPESTPDINLRNIGEGYLEFYRKYPSYYKLINLMEEHTNTDVHFGELAIILLEKTNNIWDIIIDLLNDGIKLKIFRPDINPAEIGLLLWSASNGIINVMEHIGQKHKFSLEDLPHLSNGSFAEMCKLNLEATITKYWTMIANYIKNNNKN